MIPLRLTWIVSLKISKKSPKSLVKLLLNIKEPNINLENKVFQELNIKKPSNELKVQKVGIRSRMKVNITPKTKAISRKVVNAKKRKKEVVSKTIGSRKENSLAKLEGKSKKCTSCSKFRKITKSINFINEF